MDAASSGDGCNELRSHALALFPTIYLKHVAFNPAVIIGLVTRGAKGCGDFMIYVVVEVLGALLAVVIYMTLMTNPETARKVHDVGVWLEGVGNHISLVNFFRSRSSSVL